MAFNGGPTGTFWTQSPGRDPKRSFRFKVEFGQSGPLWYAKKADKPTLSFGESTHQYLNQETQMMFVSFKSMKMVLLSRLGP